MLRTHTCAELHKNHTGKTVTLCGWVDRWRDHGGVIFVDLRDRWGVTQLVFNPQTDTALHEQASKLRAEFVICASGLVRERPAGTENTELATGAIEVLVNSMTMLNKSATPPIEVAKDSFVSEDLRLRHRFLDLRKRSMFTNLETRYRITKVVRDYLDEQSFIEVETPYLTKSTPEGARDFLVPSRLAPGHFYALPQSPQLFKQILMVAGFDRYFQIVRCFRDEDLRADRQPEHTQIDIEMSFITEEDIYRLIEGMIQAVFKKILSIDIAIPFRRMSYADAMNGYGCDKPDLRFDMRFQDMSDLVREQSFKIFQTVLAQGGVVKGFNVQKASDYSRKDFDDLTHYVQQFGAKGLAWFKVTADSLESPIAKFFSADCLRNIRERFNAQPGDVLFVVASDWKATCISLGALRLHIARMRGMIDPKRYELCWVVDFPLFDYNEEEKRCDPLHHPFTAPREQDIGMLHDEPLKALSRAYDLVLNGTEVGGGSIRIHDETIQEKIFDILRIGKEEAQEKFGFLLRALSFGAPPHGGIAIGLDRLTAMLLGLDSIRDVIAFPKTQKGTCPLTDAPSGVDQKQLKELSLSVRH